MSESASHAHAPGSGQSSMKLIVSLVLIAMTSGLLVALTYQATKPRIAYNKQKALEKAIFSVLPSASEHLNLRLTADNLEVLPAERSSEANLFAGYDTSGKLVGLAMEASSRGYQDVVKVLYAYSPESECIIGITVLESSETPGLGDRVGTDPNFLANFNCLEAKLNSVQTALAHEIVTVKNGKKVNPWEIDGISGATVTSTAIGNALNKGASASLPSVMSHLPMLEKRKGND